MKTGFILFVCASIFAGWGSAQDLAGLETRGTKQFSVDAFGIPDRTSFRYGNSIWNNFASTSWFASMTTKYIWLDWGKLPDQGNGLPDEVVDGFRFAYASNDTSSSGLGFNMYYYDSCTGWGDFSTVLEAGFSFSGLPNARGFPAGYWAWEITVDLEGSGLEFLLGYEIGIGQQLTSDLVQPVVAGPCFSKPPNRGGNGPTGTEEAFDLLSPDGGYMATYWFQGYPVKPYVSFRNELLGGQDPATNLSYGGIGLQGNEASLYCTGSWTAGGSVRFMLRKNGLKQAGSIVASTGLYWPPLYSSTYNITLGPRMPFLAVVPMVPDPVGDFDVYNLKATSVMTSLTIYMQGAITDMFTGGPVDPVDLSNGIY